MRYNFHTIKFSLLFIFLNNNLYLPPSIGMFFFFYFIFFLFLLLQLPQFSPFSPLHPAHPSLPQSIPSPLFMSMSHSHMFFDWFLPLPFPTPPLLQLSVPIQPFKLYCSVGFLKYVHKVVQWSPLTPEHFHHPVMKSHTH